MPIMPHYYAYPICQPPMDTPYSMPFLAFPAHMPYTIGHPHACPSYKLYLTAPNIYPI